MKKFVKIFMILCLLLAFILPAANALASSTQQVKPGSKLVLGGVYTLGDGETLNGDLIILGGSVALVDGSTVDGNVGMLGGNLQADGHITGSVIALGGLVQMSESTNVSGDVNVFGGQLQGEGQATIGGQINTDRSASLPLIIPGNARVAVPNLDLSFNPLWDFLWLLLQSFLWAALAVVVVLFAATPVRRVSQAVVTQPIISGGLGLLTAVVGPLVLVVITITIIGIPLAFLGLLALILAWAFGIIAIGTEVGERLAKMGKSDWAMPVSAALGTFILTFIIDTVGKVIPCVGWTLPVLVGLIGLGAVLLTRFGSRAYPIEIVATSSEPPPGPDLPGEQP